MGTIDYLSPEACDGEPCSAIHEELVDAEVLRGEGWLEREIPLVGLSGTNRALRFRARLRRAPIVVRVVRSRFRERHRGRPLRRARMEFNGEMSPMEAYGTAPGPDQIRIGNLSR